MIPAVPSRRRGAHCYSILLLILLAAAILAPASAVLASKDIQLATEGDPGDGTLSPTADAVASASGGSASSGSAAAAGGLEWVLLPDLWLAPVAVVPWPFPLDARVFLLTDQTNFMGAEFSPAARRRDLYGRFETLILAPVRQRGWHDAR